MLHELLKKEFVFFDGSMGANLQKRGLPVGQRPDVMNIIAPDEVEALQRGYCLAGSDILCTNTFGANAKALKATGCTVEEIITSAVAIAKRAGMGKTLTALDIGPVGEFISPFGPLSFDESYEYYREQAVIGEKAGADVVAIETMSDLLEVKAAMLAVRENTKLPIFVTMTFDKSGRSFTGCRPDSFALTAERLGAVAVGINCSLAPKEIYPIAEKLARATSLPLIIKPNAGLPNSVTGAYDTDEAEFARQMSAFASLGVKIIGGCCGTTPDYIKELVRTYAALRPAVIQKDTGARVCTPLQLEDTAGLEAGVCAKTHTSAEETVEDALEQADGGARFIFLALDGQTPETARDVVRAIQNQNEKPFCFVSGAPETLDAALRAVSGTAAVCGTCAEKGVLEVLTAKYGAVIIE
jgi:5-methyltetrahydrofolate--homocysteine methyltransferase